MATNPSEIDWTHLKQLAQTRPPRSASATRCWEYSGPFSRMRIWAARSRASPVSATSPSGAHSRKSWLTGDPRGFTGMIFLLGCSAQHQRPGLARSQSRLQFFYLSAAFAAL